MESRSPDYPSLSRLEAVDWMLADVLYAQDSIPDNLTEGQLSAKLFANVIGLGPDSSWPHKLPSAEEMEETLADIENNVQRIAKEIGMKEISESQIKTRIGQLLFSEPGQSELDLTDLD